MVATILLAFFISSVLVGVFMWVKHPVYRCTRGEFIERIEQVLMGQANENHWRLLLALSFSYDPTLAGYQNQLVIIEEQHWLGESKPPYLLTKEGLNQLQVLRDELLVEPL